MDYEFWPAFWGGVLGGAVMAGMRMTMKAMGVDLKMDVMRIWGTMMKVHGTAGRMLGAVIHLLVSGLIALIYAGIFDWLGFDDHLWVWGLVGGVIHWVLAGLFIGMLPVMHPEMPGRVPAPGAFAKNFGSPDVPAFLAGHLVYGLAVGILYAYFHSAGGAAAAI